ncbi:MAG: SDR family NAD(P)-dependent oxidoreductase [Pseudonocardiaceae bacterium]
MELQGLVDWLDEFGRPAHLFDLTDQVALVTGAAGGIGRWLAAGLASAGATIMLSDADPDGLELVAKALAGAGGKCGTYVADLADEATTEALVTRTVKAYDHLDVLVNCAATNCRTPALDVAPKEYDEIMAVNLRAPYFLSRAAARHMIGHGGSIVHVGSINSAQGLAGVSVYGAAKAGLAQLTRVQAIEWAPHGIRVNCLAPGFIRTSLSEPLWRDPARSEWILSRVPLRRPGEPHELVGLLLLLTSHAGSFITGQTLYADGGFLAGSHWPENSW